MRARAGVGALLSALALAAPARADDGYSPAMKRFMAPATLVDLALEGGYGHAFADNGGVNAAFLRARTGLLFVRDPFFHALGATYEISRWSDASVGLQYELTWNRGLWAQLGAFKDVDTRYGGGMASLGFAIVGVEAELRGASQTNGTAFGVYGKVRLPLGILIHALKSM